MKTIPLKKSTINGNNADNGGNASELMATDLELKGEELLLLADEAERIGMACEPKGRMAAEAALEKMAAERLCHDGNSKTAGLLAAALLIKINAKF